MLSLDGFETYRNLQQYFSKRNKWSLELKSKAIYKLEKLVSYEKS